MRTFAIKNPCWLADTFIFREHKKLGSVWVKINHSNKIEEIGVDFPSRFHMPLKEVIDRKDCQIATRLQQSILNRIGDEYFYHIKNLKSVLERYKSIISKM